MNSQINSLTETEISTRLATALREGRDTAVNPPRIPASMFQEPAHNAAVLVPLLKRDSDWYILFTRRTSSLPEHSGQVAFPGGRSDPEDSSPEITALREAGEEINLSPGDVRILGRMCELRTITNYCVTPIIGVIPWPYDFHLAREEVSRVFTIPIEWLADPINHEIQYRELPPPYSPIPVIYFKLYDDELLWGVSAEITLNFLKSLQLT